MGEINVDYPDAIREATLFIHRQYGENILVADISYHVYFSSSYFAKVFRTLTGYTVKEYINCYRLYRAAMNLKQSFAGVRFITKESFSVANLFGSIKEMFLSIKQSFKTPE